MLIVRRSAVVGRSCLMFVGRGFESRKEHTQNFARVATSNVSCHVHVSMETCLL